MLGYVPFPTITESPYALTLAPYSFLWLELQPAGSRAVPGYDLLAEPAEIPAESPATAEALLDSGWASWLAGGGLALVESSLAEWLPRQRWFGAKARTIQGVRLQQWSEIVSDHSAAAGESPAADRHLRVPPVLLYAEVNYDEGPPDVYQIPIALSTDGPADEIAAAVPYAVLAQFDSQSKTAILHDATVREDTRQLLLSMIAHDAALPLHPAHASGAASQTHEDVSASTSTVDGPPPGDDLASTASVAPVPITAQPGEAAAPPRSSVPAVSSSAQRMQPRESPTAGDGAFHAGRIEAQASAALTPALAAQASSRISSAEQSNTSIIFGDKLILKLFRRLQPGENPDVEIGRFLTETAKFDRIAPFLGEIAMTPAHAERTTLGMLQGFVASEGDGWSWFLAQADSFLAATGSAQPGALDAWPAAVRSAAEPALQAAALLGQRTAEMHIALSTPTENSAFAAEPMSSADLEHDAQRIHAQLATALDLLRRKLPSLDEALAESAIQVLAQRRAMSARIAQIASLSAAGKRIRIHGDYHLGQTLRAANDFVLLDFEGEPARTLDERRRKQSPLKDVAGMLRSFSYAAYAALDHSGARDTLAAWAAQWGQATGEAFLDRYWKAIAARPELIPPSHESHILLAAYLLEKALYELIYEINNRPAWLAIPMSGILSL